MRAANSFAPGRESLIRTSPGSDAASTGLRSTSGESGLGTMRRECVRESLLRAEPRRVGRLDTEPLIGETPSEDDDGDTFLLIPLTAEDNDRVGIRLETEDIKDLS